MFLTVLGAVMLALASISRIAIRAGETVNVEPFDIQPDETNHDTHHGTPAEAR